MTNDNFGSNDQEKLRSDLRNNLLLMSAKMGDFVRSIQETVMQAGGIEFLDEALVEEFRQKEISIRDEFFEVILTASRSIGYPNSNLVGEEAAGIAWQFLAIGYDFPLEDLAEIKEAMVMDNTAEIPDKNMIAAFSDKISIMTTGKQEYGNLWIRVALGPILYIVPYLIDDPALVDQRRSEFGLGSLYDFASQILQPNVDMPVLLPATYATAESSSDLDAASSQNEDSTELSLFQGEGAWYGIPQEILQKRAHYNDLISSLESLNDELDDGLTGTDDFEVIERAQQIIETINDCSRSNFEYVLGLCENTDLGYPAEEQVGKIAAKAAFEMVIQGVAASTHELRSVNRAFLERYTGNAQSMPGPFEYATLHDRIEFLTTGMQTYGTMMGSADIEPPELQWMDIIVPAPMVLPDMIDSRRAEIGLGTLRQEVLEDISPEQFPHLPLEYFSNGTEE